MPRYGVPRRARAFATGAITASATACAWSSGSTAVGENAPMPPVFAPVSPSPTRLWSRAGGSATTVSPSTRACSEASSPLRTASSGPGPLFAGGEASASTAASRVSATVTPLPSARPSAFTTTGASQRESASRAAAASANDSHFAVGTPASSMSSFAKDFDHSIFEASRDAPTTAMRDRRSTSPIPAAMSSSGPTIARSICEATTCCSSQPTSSGRRSITRVKSPSPALPGNTSIVDTLLQFARRQQIAYSRPPPPSTRQLRPGAPGERPGLRCLRCSQIFWWTCSPRKTLTARLLPLDRRWGLRRHVVDDAVHPGHLVHDARGDALEEVVRETRPVRGHEVLGRDRAQCEERGVGAVIALHPDAAHRRQHGERLGDAPIEVGRAQLLDEDRVSVPQRVQPLAVDRTDHAHREAGAGEGMPPEDVLGDAELGTGAADLVLEQTAQRLHDLERHHLGEAADVVVRLDACAGLRLARPRLDDIGVDRPLHEEIDLPHPLCLLLKAADEFLADDRPLTLRVLHAGELR